MVAAQKRKTNFPDAPWHRAGSAQKKAKPSPPSAMKKVAYYTVSNPRIAHVVNTRTQKHRRRKTTKPANKKPRVNYHDATQYQKPLLVPGVQGPFVTLNSINRPLLQGTATTPVPGTNTASTGHLWWITSTGGRTRAICWDIAGNYVNEIEVQWGVLDQANFPDATRPLRLSLVLRNVTKADTVQGFVRVLNLVNPPRVQFQDQTHVHLSTAGIAHLVGLCNSSSETRTHSAASLTGGKTSVFFWI